MKFTEVPGSVDDTQEKIEQLLDVLEARGVEDKSFAEARQHLANADTLRAQLHELTSTGKDAATLAREIAKDPSEDATGMILAIAMRKVGSEEIRETYTAAIIQAVTMARSELRKAAPRIWKAIDKRIKEVCAQAAKIDIPLGLVDQLTALALGKRDEWLEAEELAVTRLDLYEVARWLIDGGFYGEKPNRREELNDSWWEDEDEAASVPGEDEAPGVWLCHVAKKTKPRLMDTEQRREYTNRKDGVHYVEPDVFFDQKTYQQLEAEQAEKSAQSLIAWQEWEQLKAEVAASGQAEQPQRLTANQGYARYVG